MHGFAPRICTAKTNQPGAPQLEARCSISPAVMPTTNWSVVLNSGLRPAWRRGHIAAKAGWQKEVERSGQPAGWAASATPNIATAP